MSVGLVCLSGCLVDAIPVESALDAQWQSRPPYLIEIVGYDQYTAYTGTRIELTPHLGVFQNQRY